MNKSTFLTFSVLVLFIHCINARVVEPNRNGQVSSTNYAVPSETKQDVEESEKPNQPKASRLSDNDDEQESLSETSESIHARESQNANEADLLTEIMEQQKESDSTENDYQQQPLSESEQKYGPRISNDLSLNVGKDSSVSATVYKPTARKRNKEDEESEISQRGGFMDNIKNWAGNVFSPQKAFKFLQELASHIVKLVYAAYSLEYVELGTHIYNVVICSAKFLLGQY